MFGSAKSLVILATFVYLSVVGSVHASHPPILPGCETDLEFDWFEPIYCECPEIPAPNNGVFFTYERGNWSVLSSPRRDLGQGGLIVASTILTNNDPLVVPPFTLAPTPTPVTNGIDVSDPNSEFGWGNRFEFGYRSDDVGWSASVIGNMNAVDNQVYGVENMNAGIQPFTGTVAVLFTVPVGLLDGFVDEAGDGTIDDVDGDGVVGLGPPTDFDDLVTFIPSFSTLTVTNRKRMDGIELSHSLCPRWGLSRSFEFLYGVRFLRIDSELRAVGVGGILADSNWAAEVENKLVGPQVGFRWNKHSGRWVVRSEGRFFAALNVRDGSLDGTMASLAQPTRANFPLYLNPTSFAKYDSDVQFSPVAEARLEAIFRVTRKFSLKAGYTATYASNVGHGATLIDYTLPELTLRPLDSLETQHFFSNGVNFGFEINR